MTAQLAGRLDRYSGGQRFPDNDIAAEHVEYGALDGRSFIIIDIDTECSRAFGLSVERHPKPDDAARLRTFHHNELLAAVLRFGSNELIVIAVGKPSFASALGRFAVVAAELFAGVRQERETGLLFTVYHLLE